MYLFSIKTVVVVGAVKSWTNAPPQTLLCVNSTYLPPAPRAQTGGNYRRVPRPSTNTPQLHQLYATLHETVTSTIHTRFRCHGRPNSSISF